MAFQYAIRVLGAKLALAAIALLALAPLVNAENALPRASKDKSVLLELTPAQPIEREMRLSLLKRSEEGTGRSAREPRSTQPMPPANVESFAEPDRLVPGTTFGIGPESMGAGVYGTAFYIGNGKFVTAAHTLEQFIGNNFGRPALLDDRGTAFPIEKVVQFSSYEDLAVVSVRGAPSGKPLRWPATLPADPDARWFAGWRRIGGVDIRSAKQRSSGDKESAESPIIEFTGRVEAGFSGGPFLDSSGTVRGIVISAIPGANNGGKAISMSALTDARAYQKFRVLRRVDSDLRVDEPISV